MSWFKKSLNTRQISNNEQWLVAAPLEDKENKFVGQVVNEFEQVILTLDPEARRSEDDDSTSSSPDVSSR